MITHASQAAISLLTERLSHVEHTIAQTKGILKEILGKAGFIEKRADAEMMDSGDQIRHGHQESHDGRLAGLSRFVLREGVRTAERQPGVGIFCCPCWLAGKLLDPFLAARDYQAAMAEAEAAEAAAAAALGQTPAQVAAAVAAAPPVQVEMGAGAVPQNLAEVGQMLGNIWEVVQPRHLHSD